MLEAHYTPRAPRVHMARAAITPCHRRIELHGGADLDPTEDLLLDLGGGGMKLLTARPIHVGDVLDVELSHPALRGPVSLVARIVWTRLSPSHGGYTEAGAAFDGLRDTTRVALEQVMADELGSQVLARGRHVGWVARSSGLTGPGQGTHTFVVYDLERREVARILQDPLGYRVHRLDERGERWSRDLDALDAAVGWALGAAGDPLQLSPPLGSRNDAPTGDSSHGATTT